ncbi:MAG: hypothetical protein N2485_07355 [bacterium]|nr:hypothetical protein [bacterium]
MYDPHTHPILILQNLVNSYDFYFFSKTFNKFKKKLKYLFILNTPLENESDFIKKYKYLLDFVNSIDIPIIFKSKNYHKFFVNNYLKKKLNLNINFLDEKHFNIVDRFFIDYIKKNYKKYYKLLEDYFIGYGITKTIDAYTTTEFLEFYKLVNKKINNKRLEIYYLLDPNILFKFELKKLKEVLNDKYFLGFKFFIDGTLSNKDAMLDDIYSLNFNPKLYLDLDFYQNFLEKLYYVLKKIKLFKISFAFHCIGDKAINFALNNLLNKYITKISQLTKINFRIEHALFINNQTIQLLKDNLIKYKDVNFYFVFNPNFFFVDINFFNEIEYTKLNKLLRNYFIFRLDEVFKIFKEYNNFGIGFASDCPVSSLDYNFSIFLLKKLILNNKQKD